MTRARAHRIAEALHMACLAALLGALAMTAATAAIAFPTMRSLDPTLAGYAAYERDHWVISAGIVMERVFSVMDIAQLTLVGGACVLFAPALFAPNRRRWLVGMRGGLLAALALSVAHYTFQLRSEMGGALLQFWSQAELGNIEQAEAARNAFDDMHPRASRRLALHLAIGAALVALAIASAWRGTASNTSESSS